MVVSREVDIVERALALQCGQNLPGLVAAAPDELERIQPPFDWSAQERSTGTTSFAPMAVVQVPLHVV